MIMGMKTAAMNRLSFTRTDSIIIFFLFPVLFIIDRIIFGEQIGYGFRDIDWMMLYRFKSLGEPSFDHFIQSFQLMGAYTYQLYYVGFLSSIFGLDFTKLHIATHFFKLLAAISLYLLIANVFKSRLLAILTSVIYTASYTHIGPMFMLATGGYFLATIFMNLFLVIYYILLTTKNSMKLLVTGSVLMLATLFLSTERMYPLLPLIAVIETLYISVYKFKKESIKTSVNRVFALFFPLMFFILVYSVWFKEDVNSGYFVPQFFLELSKRINSVLSGNWQLLLYPFTSLGSIFLYGDNLKYFGKINTESFINYLSFLLIGPTFIFALLTTLFAFLISSKPLKLMLTTTIPVFIFGLITFLVTKNWQFIDSAIRIHFDPTLTVVPAIIGFYVISLSVNLFLIWLKTKNNLLLPLIIGPVFSALFIFFTWIASDLQLIFVGPHRYLSIPSIGMSLFIAGFLILLSAFLKKINITKNIAWLVFLLLLPLFIIDKEVAHDFFDYELSYAGLGSEDQTRMRNKFWSIVPNLSDTEESLFYFDESADKEHGYFDESTILAGFEFWTKFNKNNEINTNRPYLNMMRTNIQCPEHTHQSCLQILKNGLTEKDGVKGIIYQNIIGGQKKPHFYKLGNFYAMRFIDRDLIDIRKEVLKQLNLDE